jgi:hypothetical protein
MATVTSRASRSDLTLQVASRRAVVAGLREHPLQEKRAIRLSVYSRPQSPPLPIQGVQEPLAAPFGGAVHTEVPDLGGGHGETHQPAARDVQGREVHQAQVVPKLLVAADPFVVRQKVSTSVENWPVAVDLDALDVVRGMPVDDVHAGVVDEATRERPLLPGDAEAQLLPQ